MLRLLGILPSVEPTELEIAEARILEQTGYTSETIASFQHTIREQAAQMRAMEESLTTRILLLQKERDEALLGRGVGLSAQTPLPPATPDEAAALAAEPHSSEQQPELGGMPLAEAQAQQYEQHIQQMQAHIAELQARLEQGYGGAEEARYTQQQQPQQQPHSEEQHHPSPASAPAPNSHGHPANDANASLLRDLSARLSARTDEAEHWRGEAERLASEKEQLEKHLTGLLASPAVSKASAAQLQYPSPAHASGDSGSSSSDVHAPMSPGGAMAGVGEEVAALRMQMAGAQRHAEELEAALEQEQKQAEEVASYVSQLEQQTRELQEQLRYAQQQMTHYEQHHSHDQAAPESQQQQVDELQHQVAELQQQVSHLQQSLAQAQSDVSARDGEVTRLQAELLHLSSVDQQAQHAQPSADVPALQAQVLSLQQQLVAQETAAAQDKQRTQALLAEKLAQVKTVMTAKDAQIAKLKAQLQAAGQQQQQQQQQQQGATSPQQYGQSGAQQPHSPQQQQQPPQQQQSHQQPHSDSPHQAQHASHFPPPQQPHGQPPRTPPQQNPYSQPPFPASAGAPAYPLPQMGEHVHEPQPHAQSTFKQRV